MAHGLVLLVGYPEWQAPAPSEAGLLDKKHHTGPASVIASLVPGTIFRERLILTCCGCDRNKSTVTRIQTVFVRASVNVGTVFFCIYGNSLLVKSRCIKSTFLLRNKAQEKQLNYMESQENLCVRPLLHKISLIPSTYGKQQSKPQN